MSLVFLNYLDPDLRNISFIFITRGLYFYPFSILKEMLFRLLPFPHESELHLRHVK